MLTSDLYYDLPQELIAQTPVEPRDSSRLMVVDRHSETILHKYFHDLPEFLSARDLLVANDSRVIPARLTGRKPSGGKVELLLLRKLDDTHWRGLVGGRHVTDVLLDLAGDMMITAHVAPATAEEDWLITFTQPVEPLLERTGKMPLPPYIHAHLDDQERYQTVYARVSGSAAAPTAGLHFTARLIEQLAQKGIDFRFVTLHVGLDTFRPISEERVEDHKIHTEWCELPLDTAIAITKRKEEGGRVIAIGTTSVRVLESAALQNPAGATSGFTGLFITPGYQFRTVDALITNFHLPKSTLLAMLGAFMGIDLMWKAYCEAIKERYRFYSFGDAMLVL